MNVAEMIDATIANGGDGDAIVKMLIEYGHMPYDANERSAGQTVNELAHGRIVCHCECHLPMGYRLEPGQTRPPVMRPCEKCQTVDHG